MSDWDLETKVLSITAPTVPTWAVFAPEEGDGQEIWTEQVHLWAHLRIALPPGRAAEEEFLDREVPRPREKLEAYVLCEGDLALVTETGWLFLGYTNTENPDPEDWRGQIPHAHRRLERQLNG
jgi:hypothetical protein